RAAGRRAQEHRPAARAERAEAVGQDGPGARSPRRDRRESAQRGGRSLIMATLELYLIRHGIAAERGEEYPDDSKRPLTSAGIKRLEQEARALDALDI